MLSCFHKDIKLEYLLNSFNIGSLNENRKWKTFIFTKLGLPFGNTRHGPRETSTAQMRWLYNQN